MIARILANLERQDKAVALLGLLLAEEFSLLAARDTAAVTSLEFSIQELLRQLGVERTSLRQLRLALDPKARRLADVADRFDPASRERILALGAAIERAEQRCAKLASRNYEMALGLFDVTKGCLDNLRSLLIPKKTVYGARGRLGSAMPAPGRIDGRF